jgi:hypothetical protein
MQLQYLNITLKRGILLLLPREQDNPRSRPPGVRKIRDSGTGRPGWGRLQGVVGFRACRQGLQVVKPWLAEGGGPCSPVVSGS